MRERLVERGEKTGFSSYEEGDVRRGLLNKKGGRDPFSVRSHVPGEPKIIWRSLWDMNTNTQILKHGGGLLISTVPRGDQRDILCGSNLSRTRMKIFMQGAVYD